MLTMREREVAAAAAERWAGFPDVLVTQWIHHEETAIAFADCYKVAEWLVADPRRLAEYRERVTPETALAIYRVEQARGLLTGYWLEAAWKDLAAWFEQRDAHYLRLLNEAPLEVARMLRETL
jgi:hypothetical protein